MKYYPVIWVDVIPLRFRPRRVVPSAPGAVMEYEARGKGTVTGVDPSEFLIPIPSMYGINFYVWLIFVVDVGKFSIHGCYGICKVVPKNLEFDPSSLFIFGHL